MYKKINGVELRHPKYCKICGRENPIYKEISFSEKTGKKITRKFYSPCEVMDCQHDIHNYRGLFKIRCKNCGKRISQEAYINENEGE